MEIKYKIAKISWHINIYPIAQLSVSHIGVCSENSRDKIQQTKNSIEDKLNGLSYKKVRDKSFQKIFFFINFRNLVLVLISVNPCVTQKCTR